MELIENAYIHVVETIIENGNIAQEEKEEERFADNREFSKKLYSKRCR
jgi:hypothetical protein